MKKLYKGFFSYSHHDKAAVIQIKKHIEETGKFLRIIRRIRIFRDEEDTEYHHGLTTSIKAALDQSEYLLLLASPGSAGSSYVNEEVQHWLQTGRGLDRIILILWEGTIRPEKLAGNGPARFRLQSDVLPPALTAQVFSDVPLYIDLTTVPGRDITDRETGVYRAKLLEIVARLLNITVRQLEGRERNALVALIATISAVAVGFALVAWYAVRQRNEVVSQAAARHYSLSSVESEEHNDLRRALALACEAYNLADEGDPRFAVYSQRVGFLARRAPLTVLKVPDVLSAVSFSDNLAMAALTKRNKKLVVYDLVTGQVLLTPFDTTKFTVETNPVYNIEPVFSPDHRYLALIAKARSPEAHYLFVWDIRARTTLLREVIGIPGAPPGTGIIPSGLRFNFDGSAVVVATHPDLDNYYRDNVKNSFLAWSLPSLRRITTQKPIGTSYWVTGGAKEYPFPLTRNRARPWTVTTSFNAQQENTTVRIVDYYTGESVRALPDAGKYEGLIVHVELSPSGRYLFLKQLHNDKYHLYIVDAETGQYVVNVSKDRDFSFRGFGESDTTFLVSENRNARADVVSVRDGRTLFSFQGDPGEFGRSGYFEKIRKVITVTAQQAYQLYECPVNKFVPASSRMVMQYDRNSWHKVSPQGDRLGIGTDDGSLVVWQLHEDQENKRYTQLASADQIVRQAVIREDGGAVLLTRSPVTRRKKVFLEYWDLGRKTLRWRDTTLPESVTPHFAFTGTDDGASVLLWYPEANGSTHFRLLNARSAKATLQKRFPFAVKDVHRGTAAGALVCVADSGGQLGVVRVAANGSTPGGFQPLPGVSAGQYLATSRDGNYLMLAPPPVGLAEDQLRFSIWDVAKGESAAGPAVYASQEMVETMAALFTRAEKITFPAPNQYELRFDKATLRVTVDAAGNAAVQPALSFQPNRYISHRADCYSANLALVLNPTTPLATALRLWESSTGYPVSEPFYHESPVVAQRWVESRGVLFTITATGLWREWYVGNPGANGKSNWKRNAGIVLAGARFDSIGFADETGPHRYQLRQEFAQNVRRLSSRGDGEAAIVHEKFFH